MLILKKPRVKFFCINSRKESQMAIKQGASALVLVGHMPSGPGVKLVQVIHVIDGGNYLLK
jgi:phosphoribosylanthranilate isomerase